MATSPSRGSIELTDFNSLTRPLALRARGSASARTQRSTRAPRPFEPAASSQSLSGLRSEEVEDWEKTSLSERPRGYRSSRLRLWPEALRRRAHRVGPGQVDTDPQKLANMKFSHSIQFNAVPDWSSNYIAYSNLKKL